MSAPKKNQKRTTKKAEKKKKAIKKPRTKKPTSIIVTSPVEPTAQIVVAAELADDAMIESELMGEVLPYFIYQFSQEGKTVTGMTVKGVNEVVRRLNRDRKSGYNIRINPNHINIERDVEENGEKGVSVTVYAENLIDGNSGWGTKFEPYYKKGKNGRYLNTFAVEKALSKAERNAKRKLIPETAATKMIQKLMGEAPNSVKQLAPVPTIERVVLPAKPVPSSPEEIEKLIVTSIENTKNSEVIIDIDQRVQKSDKFTKEFKDKIHKMANAKVDALMN